VLSHRDTRNGQKERDEKAYMQERWNVGDARDPQAKHVDNGWRAVKQTLKIARQV
jgi:hypothetical protein